MYVEVCAILFSLLRILKETNLLEHRDPLVFRVQIGFLKSPFGNDQEGSSTDPYG
jgi:hypothetical protein